MITTKTIAAGIVAVTTLSAVPANASGFTVQFGNGPNWGYHDGHDRHRHRDRQRSRLSAEQVRCMLRRRRLSRHPLLRRSRRRSISFAPASTAATSSWP